jgi:phosphoribosylformylglycinamidine synthase subunit PurS
MENSMTATITVTFKEGVLDPEGKTVFNALQNLGYDSFKSVSTGKIFKIDIDAADKNRAREEIDEACRKLLANPVIEKYLIEVSE